jgi:hypothetical protein
LIGAVSAYVESMVMVAGGGLRAGCMRRRVGPFSAGDLSCPDVWTRRGTCEGEESSVEAGIGVYGEFRCIKWVFLGGLVFGFVLVTRVGSSRPCHGFLFLLTWVWSAADGNVRALKRARGSARSWLFSVFL